MIEIEKVLGLHNWLEVRYEVDQYRAQIVSEQEVVIAEGIGLTVMEAIVHLERKLQS